jgi:hypothetical protein
VLSSNRRTSVLSSNGHPSVLSSNRRTSVLSSNGHPSVLENRDSRRWPIAFSP